MIQRSTFPPSEEIDYPDSDGLPMSDNTLQFQWIVTIKEGLDLLFTGRDNVFVAGDLLWYPVKGHPEIRAAPDALVVFGRPKGYRGSYIQHREEGIAPQVVWEVLSPGNTAAELQHKFEFYERYGVQEYYQYDPDHIRLRGWRREDGRLVEILPIEDWTSPLTGVQLGIASGELVLTRPDGEPFRTYGELARLRDEAEQAAAAARREAAHERDRAERLAARLRELGVDPDA